MTQTNQNNQQTSNGSKSKSKADSFLTTLKTGAAVGLLSAFAIGAINPTDIQTYLLNNFPFNTQNYQGQPITEYHESPQSEMLEQNNIGLNTYTTDNLTTYLQNQFALKSPTKYLVNQFALNKPKTESDETSRMKSTYERLTQSVEDFLR